ncbi:MAG: hypothetical protein V4555_11005, partial [Acidobacteriota bacterium]
MVLSSFICKRSGTEPAGSFRSQAFSLSLYLTAAIVARYSPRLSLVFIALVAVRWLLPPRQILNLTHTPPSTS